MKYEKAPRVLAHPKGPKSNPLQGLTADYSTRLWHFLGTLAVCGWLPLRIGRWAERGGAA